MSTKIEWADNTINPVVGCSKCSPGCDNCYAEKVAYRLSKMPATAAKYAGVVNENGWTGKISALDLSCFDKLPKKACRVFVGSMTDLFNKDVPFDVQGKILSTIARNQQHTFMLLTKRADLMRKRYHTLLPNVWLGVTVCNQAEADEKIPLLLATPAAKRFVSIEPMLGPIDLSNLTWAPSLDDEAYNALTGSGVQPDAYEYPSYTQNGPSLDWVICGGENGHGARPMHPAWVRSLRDQCQAAGVPFFFKGWGEWGSGFDCVEEARAIDSRSLRYFPELDRTFSRVGKARSGRLLDGREWNEVPV